MRDAEWDGLCAAGCASARSRLCSALEHFCDHGDRDLPPSCFRWLSRADRSPGAARQGSFEARGVVLRGHATDRVFFVTAVEIDAAQPPRPSRPRRSNADPAQRQLPLALIVPRGGNDG